MRHTCSHRIGDCQYTWDVERLWGLVEDITPIPYPIDKLDHTLDWEVWGSEVISPRKLLEHYAQTIESDLHYPIIISVNSWGAVSHIYDGFHRLVKAKYKGYEKIMVKIVEEDILTQPNNYISVEELVCESCGCNPCDCHWGEI